MYWHQPDWTRSAPAVLGVTLMESQKVKAAKPKKYLTFPEVKSIIKKKEAGRNHIPTLANQRHTATAIRNQKEVPASIMQIPVKAMAKSQVIVVTPTKVHSLIS